MSEPLRIGLIGAGWIGRFHAGSIATRVAGATLAAVADPDVDAIAAGTIGTPQLLRSLTRDPGVRTLRQRAGRQPAVTRHDARIALEIALAAAESVRTGAPVELAEAVPA